MLISSFGCRCTAYRQWVKEKIGKVKDNWNEHYYLIAKMIDGKEQLDFLAFDLEDIGVKTVRKCLF